MNFGLTDEQVISGRVHLEMMRRPHLWTWEFLPLKRTRADRMEFAVLRRGSTADGATWTITEGTPNAPVGITLAVSDLTQITAAGWEVD